MVESGEWVKDCVGALFLGDKGWGECKVLGGLLEPTSQIGMDPRWKHIRERGIEEGKVKVNHY